MLSGLGFALLRGQRRPRVLQSLFRVLDALREKVSLAGHPHRFFQQLHRTFGMSGNELGLAERDEPARNHARVAELLSEFERPLQVPHGLVDANVLDQPVEAYVPVNLRAGVEVDRITEPLNYL